LKTTVVVKGFVNDADGNDGVYQVVVPGDLVVGGNNQRDAMPQGKYRHKLGNILEGSQKEHHTEQEQQVVIPSEHVTGPQADVAQIAPMEHALLIGVRNTMGHGYDRNDRDK